MASPHAQTRSACAAAETVRPAPDAEWLETDGRGGFACGTAAMCPARRYHGLLLAPLPGTATRHSFLAHFDERVASSDGVVRLSSRRRAGDAPLTWPDSVDSFESAPWPRCRFRSGGLSVCREILMPKDRHAILLRYSVPADAASITLELRPRVPMREADGLTFRNDVLRPDVDFLGDQIRCQPYAALPALSLRWHTAGAAQFTADPDWDCGVEYAMDLDRGYDGHEDLFSPGVLKIDLAPGQDVLLGATIDDDAFDLRATWSQETARRRDSLPAATDLVGRCAVAADDFLYTHPVGGDGSTRRRGILAGFPWFGEWGRDTFLSLPGLTLARGHVTECAEVLVGVIPFVADGLVPNIFGADRDDSHYGSVDAALWFARAVLLYDRAGGDREVVRRKLYPVLVAIADAYAVGSAARIRALGIGSDTTGMIFAGTPELNPTWMDAKPESGAVTPRHGCPVEIAALWYSLLAQIVELAGEIGDESTRQRFTPRVASVGETFLSRFWLTDASYLADVWRPDAIDTSVRPNMVLAAALEFSPLTVAQRRSVVARATAELLTPVGLRTLSPRHGDYAPRYTGGTLARDRAYHQGTVWPWLLGAYVEASLRVDPTSTRRAELRAILDGLLPELSRHGLHHVSEVFGGDPPHRPGGTFAQAWNTAEILRAFALLNDPLRGEEASKR